MQAHPWRHTRLLRRLSVLFPDLRPLIRHSRCPDCRRFPRQDPRPHSCLPRLLRYMQAHPWRHTRPYRRRSLLFPDLRPLSRHNRCPHRRRLPQPQDRCQDRCHRSPRARIPLPPQRKCLRHCPCRNRSPDHRCPQTCRSRYPPRRHRPLPPRD